MNLYVWNHLESLMRYGKGMAFSHAETEEQAKELLMQYFFEDTCIDFYYFGDYDCDWEIERWDQLNEEIDEKPPLVTSGIFTQFRWGSE